MAFVGIARTAPTSESCAMREAVAKTECAVLPADGRPVGLDWNYDRAEVIADGTVHAIALALVLAGLPPLLNMAGGLGDPIEYASVLVYCIGLLTMFCCSAAYNLWPVNARKWLLRRCDQSVIYVLIAATCTPFIVHGKFGTFLNGFPVELWTVAFAGVAIKLAGPDWLERLSVVPYFAVGLGALAIYAPVWGRLSTAVISLLVAGSVLYSAGVIFYLWRGLRFQHALWHVFVIAAAACHYRAVLDCMAPTST